jgi:hypothetical protein
VSNAIAKGISNDKASSTKPTLILLPPIQKE